ncbi:Protein phosphatase 1 regulatory subunit SDS22 [Astathelohania contejeani]|uniref:Protein phosphatase 1 regulatory subunit SDS22 n=1 Tax=Astathelohania contejeani TaxID=164912 RepID=A0ABQ7HV78_9MICR|nr:Protein phosphatase 1 regulatory subunit SDS22 [Thelohania contejeani]
MNTEDNELYLVHMKLTEIPGLKPNLKKLVLHRNLITSMDLIKSNTLEELDLNDNKITVIKDLENTPNLKVLDLSFNCISHIPDINLIFLEELYLICNDITEISGLNLPSLKKLDIASNNISKIKNLELLVNLEELYLGNNDIEVLENIEHLSKLKVLGIQNNLLTYVDCLKIPKSIKSLLLYENHKLTKIDNINYLSNLNYLDIEKTGIKEAPAELSSTIDIDI